MLFLVQMLNWLTKLQNVLTMSKLCNWIDSNINDGYLTEDDAKIEKYEKMKADLNECVGYLWR